MIYKTLQYQQMHMSLEIYLLNEEHQFAFGEK
jgi:hypothetical protein